jgi:mannose/cellobiose epimerase-like protein (N-acyl-D-glucosamine 2-epimerase family)
METAEAVYVAGRDANGGVFYKAHHDNPRSTDKHWWVQVETVVGFYNACQLSGRAEFAEGSCRAWAYIEARFVDRTYSGITRSSCRKPTTPTQTCMTCARCNMRTAGSVDLIRCNLALA